MPLILDGEDWDRDRSAAQLRSFREDFVELADALGKMPSASANPWAMEQAILLLRETVSLADSLLSDPEPPLGGLRSAVNQAYEVQNAVPYLMRMARSPPPTFPSRKKPAPPG